MKKRKGIFRAVLRGIVKSIPLGNVIVETVENFTAKPLIEQSTDEQINTIAQTDKPHNWVSVTIQLLIVGAIVYAFTTKQIDINKLIELLSGF